MIMFIILVMKLNGVLPHNQNDKFIELSLMANTLSESLNQLDKLVKEN